MFAILAFCCGCDSVLTVIEVDLEIDVQIGLNRIRKAYTYAVGLALATALGFPVTAFAENRCVVVLDFEDPNRSGVRQVVLGMLSDRSDVDLKSTGDVKMTAKQSLWNIDSSSDRQKLAKELGIDAWIKGSVAEKWRVVIQIISGDGDIVGEAAFSGKRKADLLAEVSQKFWFVLGYHISKSASEERKARLLEEARQKGLAAHRTLAHKKAEWRQKELFRQKELALKRERARLDQLETQRRLAVQKAAARNDEINRQKKIARERKLAEQREMARQQELARKQELAKQREYSEQQRRLLQQQQLAKQQEQARQQALARQRQSLTGQPAPVVRQPAVTPGQYFGTKASTTYSQTPRQAPATTTSQYGTQSSQSQASLYYGLQMSGSANQYSSQQPSAVSGQTSTPQPPTASTPSYGQQQPPTSIAPTYGQQPPPTASTPSYGQQPPPTASTPAATATGTSSQPSSPADLYYGQSTAPTTSPYAAQPATATGPYPAQRPATASATQKPTRKRPRLSSYAKKKLERKRKDEDDGCTTFAIRPDPFDGWIAGGLVFFILFIRWRRRRCVDSRDNRSINRRTFENF